MKHPITRAAVLPSANIRTLYNHFKKDHVKVFELIMRSMTELDDLFVSDDMKYYELSNGGFYIARQVFETEENEIFVENMKNRYKGYLSFDAYSICACLIAFSEGCIKYDSEIICDHFYKLREYAIQHEEKDFIFQASNISSGKFH